MKITSTPPGKFFQLSRWSLVEHGSFDWQCWFKWHSRCFKVPTSPLHDQKPSPAMPHLRCAARIRGRVVESAPTQRHCMRLGCRTRRPLLHDGHELRRAGARWEAACRCASPFAANARLSQTTPDQTEKNDRPRKLGHWRKRSGRITNRTHNTGAGTELPRTILSLGFCGWQLALDVLGILSFFILILHLVVLIGRKLCPDLANQERPNW